LFTAVFSVEDAVSYIQVCDTHCNDTVSSIEIHTCVCRIATLVL